MALSATAISSWSATVSCGLPSLPPRKSAVASRRLQVSASGKGKVTDFQRKAPYGPSGNYKFKEDASGSPSKNKGTYYLGKKYGGNIDGYSPIYNTADWSAKGETYEPGAAGIALWAVTFGALLLVGAFLVYSTSALS